jgi:hypothetical protein
MLKVISTWDYRVINILAERHFLDSNSALKTDARRRPAAPVRAYAQ